MHSLTILSRLRLSSTPKTVRHIRKVRWYEMCASAFVTLHFCSEVFPFDKYLKRRTRVSLYSVRRGACGSSCTASDMFVRVQLKLELTEKY